jgi:hypothetical protein
MMGCFLDCSGYRHGGFTLTNSEPLKVQLVYFYLLTRYGKIVELNVLKMTKVCSVSLALVAFDTTIMVLLDSSVVL